MGEVASRIVGLQSRLGNSKLGLMGEVVVLGELWMESESGGCWEWDGAEVTPWLEASGRCIEAVDVVVLIIATESEAPGCAW